MSLPHPDHQQSCLCEGLVLLQLLPLLLLPLLLLTQQVLLLAGCRDGLGGGVAVGGQPQHIATDAHHLR